MYFHSSFEKISSCFDLSSPLGSRLSQSWLVRGSKAKLRSCDLPKKPRRRSWCSLDCIPKRTTLAATGWRRPVPGTMPRIITWQRYYKTLENNRRSAINRESIVIHSDGDQSIRFWLVHSINVQAFLYHCGGLHPWGKRLKWSIHLSIFLISRWFGGTPIYWDPQWYLTFASGIEAISDESYPNVSGHLKIYTLNIPKC